MSSVFLWTDEQREFRAVLRRLLDSRAPLTRNRVVAEAGERHDPAVWQTLAVDLGLQSVAFPEDLGGSGGSRVELAIAAEEMGRVLMGGPFLSTVVLAAQAIVLSGDQQQAKELLPRIAAGQLTATLAVVEREGTWSPVSVHTKAEPAEHGTVLSGVKELVLDGADTDLLVVLARDPGGALSLYLVEHDAVGLATEALITLDLTRPMSRVTLDRAPAVRLGPAGEGWQTVERVLEGAAVFLAAEQAGASQACVELTADYARTRVQFGQPIGKFQGVKHRLADMAVRAEQARSAALWAAWQRPGSDEARLGAGIALSYGSEAFVQTAFDTIQLHGGIGFTWEHDAHFYLRRARADYSLLGGPRVHRARLATFLVPGATGDDDA